jgi:thiamine-monophosphate kinase
MNEFETIQKYFRPLTEGRDALQDDAAVLTIPAGYELVVTSDTLNSGTHFVENTSPENIAHKSLRVNLSDLAAMGAKPLAYQLNIAFPKKPDESWLSSFTGALLNDQKKFEIYCSGGDTTSIFGPLSISITAMGIVPTGQALRRSGAKPGDHIILTGPVGDASIGLRVLQGQIKTADDNYFINAAFQPMPRTAHIKILREFCSAAIDISDGLLADLGHMAVASGCGAEIAVQPDMFSAQAQKTGIRAAQLLTGGDDYELLLAARPEKSPALLAELGAQGLFPTKIGTFTIGQEVAVRDEAGQPVLPEKRGWTHF